VDGVGANDVDIAPTVTGVETAVLAVAREVESTAGDVDGVLAVAVENAAVLAKVEITAGVGDRDGAETAKVETADS
jgi:hypothetical protein